MRVLENYRFTDVKEGGLKQLLIVFESVILSCEKEAPLASQVPVISPFLLHKGLASELSEKVYR